MNSLNYTPATCQGHYLTSHTVSVATQMTVQKVFTLDISDWANSLIFLGLIIYSDTGDMRCTEPHTLHCLSPKADKLAVLLLLIC